MFFILSKIFALTASPVTYLIVLVCLAALCKRRRIKQVSYFLAVFILLFCSNKWVYNEVVKASAMPYIGKIDTVKTYKYGIVLGGFSSYDPGLHRVDFNENADRLTEAVRLYHKRIIKKIIIAADGSIADIPGQQNDPEVLLSMMEEWGVKRSDIILERKARNTRQNAVFTLRLIGDSLLCSPSLLITSAMHMERSLRCFEKVGIHSVPYVTDVSIDPQYLFTDIFPDFSLFSKWQGIFHEWIGSFVYGLRGW